MSIARRADAVPPARDGAPFSPTWANILADTLLTLDEASRLGGYAFTSLYGQHHEENYEPIWVLWRGGGVFRTGMTTLRVVTHTTGTPIVGDVLRIYRGDPVAETLGVPTTFTDVAIATGTQTHTITLSGHADGDVVPVRIDLRRTAPSGAGGYNGTRTQVVLCEFTPVALADAAPTLPTFTTAADITGTKLTQLADYANWLIRRIALRYDPLFVLHLRRFGPFNNVEIGAGYNGSDPNVRWLGSWRKTPLHNVLTCNGRTMRILPGCTEQIVLRINGVQVAATTVPTTYGESQWGIAHDISAYANDSVLRLEIAFLRAAPTESDSGGTPTPSNRWTINEVYAGAPGGGASALTPWAIRQASVSDASLVTWLSSARTIAAAIAARISGNGGLWGSQRLFSMRPGSGWGQVETFESWGVPATWRRAGESVVGRGRALTLGYSAGFFDEDEYKKRGIGGVGAYVLKNVRTAPVVDGNDVESFQYYLDAAPGLPMGAPFNVRGVESYVLMERLKVVE